MSSSPIEIDDFKIYVESGQEDRQRNNSRSLYKALLTNLPFHRVQVEDGDLLVLVVYMRPASRDHDLQEKSIRCQYFKQLTCLLSKLLFGEKTCLLLQSGLLNGLSASQVASMLIRQATEAGPLVAAEVQKLVPAEVLSQSN